MMIHLWLGQQQIAIKALHKGSTSYMRPFQAVRTHLGGKEAAVRALCAVIGLNYPVQPQLGLHPDLL